MKTSWALLLALFLFPSLAVSSPDLSSYQLVFGDEFNDTQLNANNWGSSHIWGPYVDINQEKQYYVDKLGGDAGHAYNPFVLNGSTLKIKAIPTTGSLTASEQPNQDNDYWNQNPEFQYNADYDQDSREYLSGILSSVDKFDFTHGYAEARIKLPEGQGLWSAFWLLTSKYVEDAPEIDIMEALGHNTDTVHHTMHYFDTSNNWQLISTPTYNTTGVDYTADFHVYGLSWSPKKITWYVDGVAVKTLTDQDFKIPTQSMYVLLNVATGGTWPGDPDNTTQFPAEMEVDYVRVYEQQPVNTITPAILNSDYQIMFEDNFNGTSLNDQKWNTNYLWGPYFPINNEHQIYIDKHGRHSQSPIQPFTVANGVLSIEAKALAAADVPDQPPINDPEWQDYSSHQYNSNYGQIDGWTPTYSSGLITSYDNFKFVNGYVEARIKLPAGGGLWPAFWLLNGYYVGPQPEIDIIELDGAQTNVGHHSYHYSNSVGELQSSAGLSSSGTGSFTDDFHVYGVQWEAGLIKWYVDGNVVRTVQGPEVSTQLMYILLNLAVGGNFVGDVDPSVFPTTMDVDYVRAYQRRDHEEHTVPDTIPEIISPVDGSLLSGEVETFVWSLEPDVTRYTVWVGATPGGDEYGRFRGVGSNVEASGIPTDGSAVYATLKWNDGQWHSGAPISYTAALISPENIQSPEIISPVDGSLLSGEVETFVWSVEPDVTRYTVWVGATSGGDEYGRFRSVGSNVEASGIPTDGSTVYATLKWNDGQWHSGAPISYTAALISPENIQSPEIISPVDGSLLSGEVETFVWSVEPDVTKYTVWVGATPGGDEYGRFRSVGSNVEASGIPTDGSAVYATLKWNDGQWRSGASISYTAAQ